MLAVRRVKMMPNAFSSAARKPAAPVNPAYPPAATGIAAYEARNQATSRGLFNGAAHSRTRWRYSTSRSPCVCAKARGCCKRDQNSSADSASRSVSSTVGYPEINADQQEIAVISHQHPLVLLPILSTCAPPAVSQLSSAMPLISTTPRSGNCPGSGHYAPLGIHCAEQSSIGIASPGILQLRYRQHPRLQRFADRIQQIDQRRIIRCFLDAAARGVNVGQGGEVGFSSGFHEPAAGQSITSKLTRRSSASLRSSAPVPTSASREPLPAAIVRGRAPGTARSNVAESIPPAAATAAH